MESIFFEKQPSLKVKTLNEYSDLNLKLSSNPVLKYISNADLLLRTENLVQTERKIMHLILSHILEIMDRKLYADLGFDSMYTMMIKKYGYSEASAIRHPQN